MKKIFALLALTLSLNLVAQDYASTPTTETEYAYATKGYKVQVESGLDMKKGYSVQDVESVKIGAYNFDIKALVRNAQKEVAAMMVVTTSAVSGKRYYMCIPHGNAVLMNLYLKDLQVWDDQITLSYAYLISAYYSEVAARAYKMSGKM